MAREINGALYRIRTYAGIMRFVECETIMDLYHYIAKNTMNGLAISSVNRMYEDGSTPKEPVYTNKQFKRILSQYRNFAYAKRQLMENGYNVEESAYMPNVARVYYRDNSGDFTELSACDETRDGYITIEGKAQHIDEWLNHRFI